MVRKILGVLCVVVSAVLFYNYMRSDSSNRIKNEMLRLLDDMELTAEERAEAKRLVEAHHAAVFESALDVSRKLGNKFNENLYYDELFTQMIDQASADGHSELAQKLDSQRKLHSLNVTER